MRYSVTLLRAAVFKAVASQVYTGTAIFLPAAFNVLKREAVLS